MTFSESPIESARFGLRMGRLTVGWDIRPDGPASVQAAARALTEALSIAEEDIVVVRYPAASLELAAALLRSRRGLLPAGTLTYWTVANHEFTPNAPVPGLVVRSLTDLPQSTHDLQQVVMGLVAEIFSGYGNHYMANPILTASAALEGYQEWAMATAVHQPNLALILELEGDPVGLATLAFGSNPEPHIEVLLAGVRPSAQGRGLYGMLIGAAVDVARQNNVPRLVISTQAHNVRVQRSWARLGLAPLGAIETVHALSPTLLAGSRLLS